MLFTPSLPRSHGRYKYDKYLTLRPKGPKQKDLQIENPIFSLTQQKIALGWVVCLPGVDVQIQKYVEHWVEAFEMKTNLRGSAIGAHSYFLEFILQ